MERRRAGKLLGEAHVGELHLLRAVLEEGGLVETAVGGRLQATRRCHELHIGTKGALQAELFRVAFWRVSLNLFGAGECRDDGEDLEDGSWRKSALFDRFLAFGTDLVRTEGALH